MKRMVEVLLVEDNEDDTMVMMRGFRKYNLINKIHVMKTGAEAIKFLDDFDGELKLIILDVNLPPGPDGFDVLKAVRKNKKTKLTPVVMLTVDKNDVSIEKGYSLGANSYMAKPVDFNKFTETTSALGFYWCFLNETA